MAVLYESGTAVSQAVGGGLGFLSDAVGIQVTNSVNGEFYLEMLYPNDSLLSKELLENRLIKADAGTSLKNQLFIIKKVQRFNDGSQSLQTSSGSSVSIPTGIYVYAEQVGLSLTKDISLKQPTVTINSQDATGALTVWKNNLAINTPFVVDSDIATQNSTAFTLADFQHASDALAGTTGSILDVWGGEYKFDNYHISLLQRMGKTVNGILSYGRNIQTIEQESDISTIYNSIIPYATVSQPSGDSSVDIIHVLSGSDYIQAGSYANQYPYPITLPVDFSDQFYASDASADEKQGKYAYSDAQLKALAQKYLSDNEVGKPTANMTVTAIDLSKSLEYQGTNEQPIELGDIVPTNYEPLAISGTAEVTQTVWDDITKQYIEYTFGQKQTLTSAMASIADNAVNGVQKQVTAINTIINGLGQPDSYSGDPTAGYPADPVLGQKFFLTDGNNQYIYQYSYDDATGTYYWKELVSTYTSQEIDNKVSSVVSDAKSYTDDLNDSLTPQIAAIDSQASNAVVGAQTANNNVNSLSSATDISTSQANSNASQAINQASEAILAASNANVSVSSLSGELTTNKTAIASNAQVIATKADQTTVNSLGSQVGSQSTLLAQTASEVALKADSAAVSSLSGQVSENSAQIAVNANSIQDTVTSINNLQIGGRNLVLDTSNAKSQNSNGTINQDTYNQYVFANPISTWGSSGQVLTLSFNWSLATALSSNATIGVFFNVSPWLPQSFTLPAGQTSGTISAQFALTQDIINAAPTGLTIRLNYSSSVTIPSGTTLTETNFKLEKGNKATDWSPAPEDMATEADLTITNNAIATKVSQADFSTYQTQTASAIAAKVSNDSFASYQQQVANGFSQTVSTSTFNTLQTQVNNLGQTNLIANSDFNPDTGGWITWQNATLGTVLSNLHNVSGKNVMEITASTTGLGPRVISQPIPINSLNSTTSPTVSLSFAYYVFTGSTNYFQIQYLDDAGTDMGYAGAVALSGSGWQAYVLQNQTLTIPTGATHIALLFDARANGKLGIAMPMLVNGSTIGSYVPGPYVGQTSSQTQTVEAITDFVTDGNGNIGTSFLTAFENTSLMTGWDGSSSIFQQTVNSITLALQSAGSPNLLSGTNTQTGWTYGTNGTAYTSTYFATTNGYGFQAVVTGVSGWSIAYYPLNFTVVSGQTYTISFKINSTVAASNLIVSFMTNTGQNSIFSGTFSISANVDQTVSYTGTASDTNSQGQVVYIQLPIANGTYKIWDLQVQQGSVATAWSPNTQKDLIPMINIQAGTTLIQNDKLYLNASSIVFGGTAFINDAMVTDLSASKLTAGTIDASKISVINLDANNISANGATFFKTQWQSNYGSRVAINSSSIVLSSNAGSNLYLASNYMHYTDSSQTYYSVNDFGNWIDWNDNITSAVGLYTGIRGPNRNNFWSVVDIDGRTIFMWAGNSMSHGANKNVIDGTFNFFRNVNIHGALKTYSLLSLKNIVGTMGTTEAIDEILKTDIIKYYFKTDTDNTDLQLSPIIDDVNTTKQYYAPDIITGGGTAINVYAMTSMSWLAIKQFAAELGDSTIKGTAILDGKNIKANSMSVNSLDANYIAVNNGILNLSSSDKTSVVQINSGSVLIQNNTSAGVLDGQMLMNAYSFSVFYGSNLMTMEADGIHMLNESSLLFTNIYNDYIEMSASYTSTQAISVGGLVATYDSNNKGGVYLVGNTAGMGGSTHNSSSGNYWNANNIGLAYRNSTTNENSLGIAINYNIANALISLNSNTIVNSNGTGGSSYVIYFPNSSETNVGTTVPSYNRIYSTGNSIVITGHGGGVSQLVVGYDTSAYVSSPAIYARTTSSASNVFVDSTGTLARSTSARKYKLDDRDATSVINNAHKILQINPKTWYDKTEIENISNELAGGQKAPQGNKIKLYYGFIADDFDSMGLKEVVQYDENGEVDALAYDRITMYHQVILQDHDKRIAELERSIKDLKKELSTLKSA
ncbi:phage tail spike protein [Oenococcus oeni]